LRAHRHVRPVPPRKGRSSGWTSANAAKARGHSARTASLHDRNCVAPGYTVARDQAAREEVRCADSRSGSRTVTNAPVFAAVLVNYNAGPELERALRSIADDSIGQPWEGVVVDNASTDGSNQAVASFTANVRLLLNPTNVGFARGVNQGIAATTAPYVLIMNPDCRLIAGAIKGLRAVLDAHPRCAITGPRILDPEGSVQGSARGDPDMLTGLFGRTSFLRNIVPFLAVAKRNVVVDEAIRGGEESTVVDWLSGACMLARRD